MNRKPEMSELLAPNSLRHYILQDKGTFDLRENQGCQLEWCDSNYMNNVNDAWTTSFISITPKGHLVANSREVLIGNLQSCAIQLLPTVSPPIISITPYTDSKKRIFIKVGQAGQNDYTFDEVVANLLVWSYLRPEGLSKKYGFHKSIVEDDKFYGNELLVCRFKVYGPLPSKAKNLKTVDGPKVPINNGHHTVSKNEGWFMAMGHLKPNGVLDLLLESDGSLLYSINISVLFSSEIRQIDHSIFQNSNILYLGIIQELRSLNSIKSTELSIDQTKNFIVAPPHVTSKHDLQHFAMTNRILLDFPLHIDLEDWFVTLSSFTKREFIGNASRKAKQLRCLRKIHIDIIEAKFDDEELYHKKRLYTELNLWNSPWFRTSVVECYRNNPFWRETFKFDLPISTNYFQILIKQSSGGNDEYGVDDAIIGTVYITPDMLISNEVTDRLTVYDTNTNSSVGRIFINLTHNQHYILPAEEYRIFEKMIVGIPFEELIEFLKPLTSTADKLEEYSLILVDVFQTLGKENAWFLALMNHELLPVDSLTRNNRIKGTVASKTTNVFNTLFRGNSMLTKSLEQFNFRVGQEYLEKTIGEFVNKVSEEKLDCEIDPRMIEEEDPNMKQKVVDHQSSNLLKYVEELWELIYTTSNDLPAPIKTQLTKFRLNVENSVEPDDTVTPLNCLSAFIFLRFFCPAILNPKLFYLTKNHQTGNAQRTLTLIAKILLNLANRSKFVEHKEPYLIPFNDFITRHEPQVFEYFDKLTGRKLDFQPKILELSDDVTRPSLNIPTEILEELPTNPYLIDKYLRIVELMTLLNGPLSTTSPVSTKATLSVFDKGSTSSDEQLFKIHTIDDDDGDDDLNHETFFQELHEMNGGVHSSNDQAAKDQEVFLKNLLKSSSDDFDDLVKSNLKLPDLQGQSHLLISKTKKLINNLKKPETVARNFASSTSNLSSITSDPDITANSYAISSNWVSVVDRILDSSVMDLTTKQIFFVSSGSASITKSIDTTKYRFLNSGSAKFRAVSRSMPLKVGEGDMIRSSSMGTLRLGEGSKNRFRKLFGRKSSKND